MSKWLNDPDGINGIQEGFKPLSGVRGRYWILGTRRSRIRGIVVRGHATSGQQDGRETHKKGHSLRESAHSLIQQNLLLDAIGTDSSTGHGME
jgi:hypothetical protein